MDHRGLMEPPDRQDPKEPWDPRDQLVLQGPRAAQVKTEALVNPAMLGPRVNPDQVVRRDYLGRAERLACLDPQEMPDPVDPRVKVGPRAQQAPRDNLDSLDRLDQLDLQEVQDQLDPGVLLVILVPPGLQDPLGLLVQRVQQATREALDQQDRLVLLDHQDQQALRVLKEMQGT
jgi:hypothetical protein